MTDTEIKQNIQKVQSFRATPGKLKESLEAMEEEGVEVFKFMKPKRQTKMDAMAEKMGL